MIQILMAHVLRQVTETNNSWQKIQLRIFTSKINFISQRQQFNSYKKVICIKKGHQKKKKKKSEEDINALRLFKKYIYIYIYMKIEHPNGLSTNIDNGKESSV